MRIGNRYISFTIYFSFVFFPMADGAYSQVAPQLKPATDTIQPLPEIRPTPILPVIPGQTENFARFRNVWSGPTAKHVCAENFQGELQCWGLNFRGQLGIGNETPLLSPGAAVPNLRDVAMVSAGAFHTCAIQRNGTAFCWGEGHYGQLGPGNYGARVPVPVQGIRAVSIAAGFRHTCAALTDGQVKCWGLNDFKQSGAPAATVVRSPQTIEGIGNAVEVSVGMFHSCALLRDGKVKCWGLNSNFQLGRSNPQGIPSAAPVEVPLQGVKMLSVGSDFACAALETGESVCWGIGTSGQLGRGSAVLYAGADPAAPLMSIRHARQLAAGGHAGCALANNPWPQVQVRGVDETVSCWGGNYAGQLGNGAFDFEQGKPGALRPYPVRDIGRPARIVAGHDFFCALYGGNSITPSPLEGQLRCWGANYHGQLGAGLPPSISAPVKMNGFEEIESAAVGERHACSAGNGLMRCWGAGDAILAPDQSLADRDTPYSWPLADVAESAAGQSFTCFRRNDGSVGCWGKNDRGQLGSSGGQNRITVESIVGLRDVQQLSCGRAHCCVRTGAGQAKCWGDSSRGQAGPAAFVGRRPITTIALQSVASVATGPSASCAILGDRRVYCWGHASWWSEKNLSAADQKPFLIPGVAAEQLVVSGLFACARRPEGTVSCWTLPRVGQLSANVPFQPQIVNIQAWGRVALLSASAYEGVCALIHGGEVSCTGFSVNVNETNNSYQLALFENGPIAVQGLPRVTNLFGGGPLTCARTERELYCWGMGGHHLLGATTLPWSSVPVVVSGPQR